jgi:RNA polymerase sigma-70 factor (ECF subfamily)
MSLIPETVVPDSFLPYESFRHQFGFVPAIFRAQSLLPSVIEAEAQMLAAVLLAPGTLTRMQKETILLMLAYEHCSEYCVSIHPHALGRLGLSSSRLDRLARDYHDGVLSDANVAMIDFALTLGVEPTAVDGGDIEALRAQKLSDNHILEAILTAALANFLCTLSAALDVEPDFQPPPKAASSQHRLSALKTPRSAGTQRPYLAAVARDAQEFSPFAFFDEQFGFVPNLFRAQTLRPDVIEAEAFTLRAVLLAEDVLSRLQKEFILLVVSAQNLNTYCVAVHCEMLRHLGVSEDTSDQIAVDHRHTALSNSDKALLDAACKIARQSPRFDADDRDGLRRHGFTDPQILETVVMVALSNFLNTLQAGLGTVPDFHPRRIFDAGVNLSERLAHPMPHESTARESGTDPDGALVADAMSGSGDAFEVLVRRHHGRIYRLLLCVTGTPQDAEDSAQWAFVKAFQHLGDFKGHATFRTWLTRIAINEGRECLRRREPLESLSSNDEDGTPFQPQLVLPWAENPEQLYQREELRALVERAVMSLPLRYRMAVLLRDLQQFSTAEAAAALGLETSTLKTHLLRGRLMLREALAPHFARQLGTLADV